jgi:ribonuclease HII
MTSEQRLPSPKFAIETALREPAGRITPVPVGPFRDKFVAVEGGAYDVVIGVDEVGCAALAGPLVAGAVALDLARPQPWWDDLDDSKRVPRIQRERLATYVAKTALATGFGVVKAEDVDRLGVMGARLEAMAQAVRGALAKLAPGPLPTRVAVVADDTRMRRLADRLPADVRLVALDHADELCGTVAAASIIAKVVRDGLMRVFDRLLPGYGWAHNVGYPTREHVAAMDRLGVTHLHRRSFRPVAEAAARALAQCRANVGP